MAVADAPLIGIPCRRLRIRGEPERFGQNRSYVGAVLRAGGAPFLIPHVEAGGALRALYEQCDGLLLAGGRDVDPKHYGEAPHPALRSDAPESDAIELCLARWTVEEGKPLLAICRGVQVLNVALGGTLYQDIASQVPGALKHDWFPRHARDRLSHAVALEPGTRLAHFAGSAPWEVNSLHHQALNAIAPRLRVAARAPDGVVEAAEVVDHPFALGVQWHPEELAPADPRSQRLFDALVEAAGKHRARSGAPRRGAGAGV